MGYTVRGEAVSSGVTVKVYVEDAAVDFVAKHTDMGKRQARKELVRLICGYGSFVGYEYLTVHGGEIQIYGRDAREHYGEGADDDFTFGYFVYLVEVQ